MLIVSTTHPKRSLQVDHEQSPVFSFLRERTSFLARFGVRTCRDILCSTTVGAVAHSFLAMDGFVRGTGGGRFAPLPMTYSCGFTGAPAEGNVSRNHSQRGMSCSLMWSP